MVHGDVGARHDARDSNASDATERDADFAASDARAPEPDAGRSDSDARPSDGGALDPVEDSDGDGIPDIRDVCPDVRDVDQADADGDGAGDACDPRPDDFGHRLQFQALVLAGGVTTAADEASDGRLSSGAGSAESRRHRVRGRLSVSGR